MWLWTSQCWHSTLVTMSDRVCRQRSVPYRPAHVRASIGRCPEQPSLVPYASSKSAAESPLYSYHHLDDMDAVVLRHFTVYGEEGIRRTITWYRENRD